MPSPIDALKRAHNALRRGGRIAVATWGPPDKNPFISIPLGMLRKHVEIPTTPPDAPGVFAFANPKRLKTTLQGAGFQDVVAEAFAFDISVCETGEEAWRFIREIAPPIAQLYNGQLAAVQQSIDVAITSGLSRFHRADLSPRLAIPAETWIAVGTKA